MKKIALLFVILLILGISPVFSQSGGIGLESVDAGIMNAIPIINYSDLVSYGIGVHGGLNLGLGGENSILENIVIAPEISFTYEFTRVDTITTLFDLLWQVGVGYDLELISDSLFFTPVLSYGGLVHLVDGNTGFAAYYDSLISVSMRFSYMLSERLGVYINPSYQLFLEDANQGHQILAPLGVRIYL